MNTWFREEEFRRFVSRSSSFMMETKSKLQLIQFGFVSCQPATHDATCLHVFCELCRCIDNFGIVNTNCICVEEESSLI